MGENAKGQNQTHENGCSGARGKMKKLATMITSRIPGLSVSDVSRLSLDPMIAATLDVDAGPVLGYLEQVRRATGVPYWTHLVHVALILEAHGEGEDAVVAALTLHTGQYGAYPANLLLMGGVPILFSWSIYRFVDAKLPNHFFIYIFLNCFFGAGLAMFSVGLVSSAFAALSGAYSGSYLLEDYLPYYFLMAWAESFSTGMIMTILVVYKPEWVATCDDRRYLHSK